MAVWETDAALAAQTDLVADFARAWQATSKVVYSTTLPAPVEVARHELEWRRVAACAGEPPRRDDGGDSEPQSG